MKSSGPMILFYADVCFSSLQFVNRQFIPDGAYSGGEKEQGDEWTTETEVCCKDIIFHGFFTFQTPADYQPLFLILTLMYS